MAEWAERRVAQKEPPVHHPYHDAGAKSSALAWTVPQVLAIAEALLRFRCYWTPEDNLFACAD